MLATAQSRTNLAPEDVEAVEEEDDELLKYEAHQREYRVASTGAKATLQNAKALIHQYCQKLPSDRWDPVRATVRANLGVTLERYIENW